MTFTSLAFLGFFILLLASLFFVRNDSGRMYLLLFASYVFYGAWNAYYVLLIILSSLWGWGLGMLMSRAATDGARKFYLILSVFLSLGTLGYFKYANFFAQNVSALFGSSFSGNLDIVLPVGISFFTFQTLSYTFDLYRGNLEVCRSLPKFMLFVAFFPQLVAGPIVRASEFLPQLDRPVVLRPDNLVVGLQIFLAGAVQKVLIADNLSQFVDPVFFEPTLYSAGTLWLGAVAYSVQIFCDFSGYSLMAIGVARVLGFKLPENFNMPYISRSITEFWRRWHITLSTWLRDYLYISLGGNRVGVYRNYTNLMITMVLGGLWHGASWNFIFWGAAHGVALAVHKMWTQWSPKRNKTKFSQLIAWVLTMLFVVLMWIPFRAPSFSVTLDYLSRLMPDGTGIVWMHAQTIVILSSVAAWHFLAVLRREMILAYPMAQPFSFRGGLLVGSVVMLIFLYAPLETSPFIYFQF